jgi:hypothetical protein
LPFIPRHVAAPYRITRPHTPSANQNAHPKMWLS